MARNAQLSFFSPERKIHGGEYAKGVRKEQRPIVVKRSMHLVLRSDHARGDLSFVRPRNRQFIASLLPKLGLTHGVRIYRFAIVGNHLHLIVKAGTRLGFQNFLRQLGGKIAQFVTGAVRGKPFGKRFWKDLAFSRIVEWGRDFINAARYTEQNQLEADGAITYQPRNPKRKYPSPNPHTRAKHSGNRSLP